MPNRDTPFRMTDREAPEGIGAGADDAVLDPEPANDRYLTGQEQRQVAARRAAHKRERQNKAQARRLARR